ncbi:MAG: hypothetical protein GY795_26355 [Desulfobacterales bacterium]|nr:hypothetical protein [Desulfobacterales bacterium]
MKDKKFHVPDLKPKVRTLEAIFGEKFMRSELNPRTVDKWLKEPDPAPYLTSLKKYFGVISMKESDMIKPRDEFSKKVAEIFQVKSKEQITYNTEDVITIYNSFLEGHRHEPLLLGQTLKAMQTETIKNDFKYLKGCYHMYHYWKSSNTDDTGKIRRNLVEIYDLDEKTGLMNCRIMASPMKNLEKEDWWIYEGWVFNIKNKLFWLSECVKGMLPEIVTFNIFKPSFWPDPEHFFLYGVVLALSLKGVPCASNMILKKIRQDDELKDRIGYFSPQEIEAEGHDANLLDRINNEIKNPCDILAAKPFDY